MTFVPDPPDMTKILGMDTSSYEDDNETPRKILWDQAALNGVRFMNTRASIGLAKDADFQDFWRDCKGIMPRGAYHFLYPASLCSIRGQARLFAEQLRADPGEYAPCVDFEFSGTQRDPRKPSRMIPLYSTVSELEGFIAYLHEEFPIWPWKTDVLIYSAFYYWRDHGSVNPIWAKYGLWLAAYGSERLNVPAPWSAALFWQWTPSGDGKLFGTESNSVDLNYFMGTEGQFAAYFDLETVPGPGPEPKRRIMRVITEFDDGTKAVIE